MKLLTLREVADALQVSERTIRRLVNRGDLAGFRVGDRGQVRVKCEDLEAYLERQRVHADGQTGAHHQEVDE
ncbi:helix-turn-helix domain-containing protein [Aromatoleum anaerobium]|uniref:helix-turn-helix domain-containing protein n=1 Tax=Aromatoleum anaerobium TaxID=182180 RepID=UPI001B7CE7CA|nr:helix-turn-helix domain-containing protein [Aromatoleum anaerobium]MCK0508572.1 helix-turn-helix domain-containing protein [Aromatoleum anaerobium]